MKRIAAIAALASATLLGACVAPQPYGQTVVVAPAPRVCDTSFRVVNESGAVVQQLYFSHSSLGSWGADQLGASVLYPGRYVNYRANNPGNYDFRIVWSNGRASELRQVNICVASRITVTSRGLSAQ
ncbi:hypothetical protein EJV46_19640 [Roseococcus sp. SYP-B2431]|uniref:hypothetical protein n=1 Tax=Roseococcus sp. SYP-B2431 TaxID=2496640 RepID=UPI00103ACE45|nr:hypothetical protein [Roseococcus sp. SYP-B2431]TCH96787.1 hypothetical protein EJV46_19640 [Roseococcus sp. SYP-B2431]